MRKVKYKQHNQALRYEAGVLAEPVLDSDFIRDGILLEWVPCTHEGYMSNLNGIVERPDGTIVVIDYKNMKFTNPTDPVSLMIQ